MLFPGLIFLHTAYSTGFMNFQQQTNRSRIEEKQHQINVFLKHIDQSSYLQWRKWAHTVRSGILSNNLDTSQERIEEDLNPAKHQGSDYLIGQCKAPPSAASADLSRVEQNTIMEAKVSILRKAYSSRARYPLSHNIFILAFLSRLKKKKKF